MALSPQHCWGYARSDPPPLCRCLCSYTSVQVSAGCAHACVCRCMYMFLDVPAGICTCAQVIVMWADACAHVHFGGCMALCVCTHPCRGCAHLEKSQGRQSSGVLSSGLCLWGLSLTGCSSPAQKQPLLHEWGSVSSTPWHSLGPTGCTPSDAAPAPMFPGWSTPGGCRGRFGDILPGLLVLSPVWVLWSHSVSASSSFLD